jgi:hypothetical protein
LRVSANSSVIKSIKQRDLLNTWLRLYARDQRMPRIEEYQPERFVEELPDLVYYTINATLQPPRLTIQSDGTRTSSAAQGEPRRHRGVPQLPSADAIFS